MSRCEGEGLSKNRNFKSPKITMESIVKVLLRAPTFDQVIGLGFYSEDRVTSVRGI